jgi:hypothetical protein
MNSWIPRAAGPSVFIAAAGPFGLFLIWYPRTHHPNELNCHFNAFFLLSRAAVFNGVWPGSDTPAAAERGTDVPRRSRSHDPVRRDGHPMYRDGRHAR